MCLACDKPSIRQNVDNENQQTIDYFKNLLSNLFGPSMDKNMSVMNYHTPMLSQLVVRYFSIVSIALVVHEKIQQKVHFNLNKISKYKFST